jgi:4-hydroxymandelate oxidase
MTSVPAAALANHEANRRHFLRFLAASPLLALPEYLQAQASEALASPADALNVMDFEAAARRILPPAHWGYLATGTDDEVTLRTNVTAYQRIQIRPRRLVDASKADLNVEFFGQKWETPVFICPVGNQKAFHPDAELAVARAARARKFTMMLSGVTSNTVEDVAAQLGTPPWFQLYMPRKWADTEKMVKRVEDAGCPVLVWTIDLLTGRNIETAERSRRMDTRDCSSCHLTRNGGVRRRPMFDGLTGDYNPPEATWEFVDRLRKTTRMKLVLKGIETHEDARLCREHGVDAIYVSNHGGRAMETGRGSIECLPEVVAAAGNVPVLFDGGIRRGTDIFKALALGARAVGVGRPYLWGLSAFGQPGVERVLDILRAELLLTMRQAGTPSVRQIGSSAVLTRG